MKLLRPDQIADMWCVSKRTIYRLIDEDELPAIRIRGSLRIPEAEIEKYIDRQNQKRLIEQLNRDK